MRLLNPFFSFALACALGIGLCFSYLWVTEWIAPAFTRAEATAMLGRRVRNVYESERLRAGKCPERGGLCAFVRNGERGQITDVLEVSPGQFFVVVRWDEPTQGEPMLSYVGRMSYRIFLQDE